MGGSIKRRFTNKETRVGRWGQKTEIRGDVLYEWPLRNVEFMKPCGHVVEKISYVPI